MNEFEMTCQVCETWQIDRYCATSRLLSPTYAHEGDLMTMPCPVDELVRVNWSLVSRLVSQTHAKLPTHVSRDELVSAGLLALTSCAMLVSHKPSNPWSDGLLAVSVLILLPLGVLTILGLLIAMALGVDLSRGPDITAQTAAIFLLSVIAVLGFVFVMAARWDSKHRRQQ